MSTLIPAELEESLREIQVQPEKVRSSLFQDRTFWVYFIIVLVFIIIGASALLSASQTGVIVLVAIWVLVNIILVLILCCLVRMSSSDYCSWFIYVIFASLLLFSTIWAVEFKGPNVNVLLRNMAGIIVLLGSLVLVKMSLIKSNGNILSPSVHSNEIILSPPVESDRSQLSVWLTVVYALVWLGLVGWGIMSD